MEPHDVHAAGKMFPAWILVAFNAHHVSVGLLAAPALLMSPLGVPRQQLLWWLPLLLCPSGGKHHDLEGSCEAGGILK